MSKLIHNSEIVEYSVSVPNNELSIHISHNTPLEFNIVFDTDFTQIVYNTLGSIKIIKIYIKRILDISIDDTFILHIYNTSKEIIYDIYLTYVYENDVAYLIYENTNIEHTIFSYILLSYSSDDIINTIDDINCELSSSIDFIVLLSTYETILYYIQYMKFSYFSIISPGMLNLAYENYIILRCEEIENHIRGSYDVKEFSPGLGVLNIDVQGYASGRTEFYSIIYKEFHPIGRLSKLKFRFERKSSCII